MTLIPDFYVTGIVAILVGLAVVAWSSTLINRRWGGAVLIVLSLVLLLVGGGFLPPALGIIAGVIAARTGRQTGSMSAP